jgi:hypothetical protein
MPNALLILSGHGCRLKKVRGEFVTFKVPDGVKIHWYTNDEIAVRDQGAAERERNPPSPDDMVGIKAYDCDSASAGAECKDYWLIDPYLGWETGDHLDVQACPNLANVRQYIPGPGKYEKLSDIVARFKALAPFKASTMHVIWNACRSADPADVKVGSRGLHESITLDG